jgi:pimeloyl-ACP methyl ester carboxylesterase
MKRAVTFYSEEHKLSGDVFIPDDLPSGEKRSAVVLCHGYTGVKDLYLPDNARAFNQAGYVAMTFDYKGWGDSEGSKSRLAPYSRVADVQAAMTFLENQLEVKSDSIGLFGVSYGGATVSWVGAVDQRAACIVSVVGIGHGGRWMRSVRRPDEWFDLLEWSRSDRERRVTSGKSTMVDRGEILLADRASAELSAKARQDLPSAISTLPLEFVDETLSFHPEWIVEKISPRPILFITTDNDRLVPPEESQSLYNHAKEPKKLVTLKGHSHYAVYQDPAFSEVMNETIAWFDKYIPPNYES